MWQPVREEQQTPTVRLGRDVAVIAFIPRPTRRRIRRSAYGRDTKRLLSRLAYRHLFWSGNDSPPPRQGSAVGFASFHNGQQFRGTLGLADVDVSLGQAGEIVGASFKHLATHGYTRLGQFTRVGTGMSSFDAEINAEFLAVRVQSFYRVSGLIDRTQALLTRHRAPYAWVCLDYVVRRDGTVGFRLHASAIPSLWYSVDWDAVEGGHDMLLIESADIEDFLDAGEGVPALEHASFTWPPGFAWSEDESAAFAGLRAPGALLLDDPVDDGAVTA